MIRAFAKVNLALRVEKRSSDGFHPLHGIFQTVSIADDLDLVPADEDEISIEGGWAPQDTSNLAWKAVEAVRDEAAETFPLRLRIDKRIPSQAGLGGASADAAAALIAASRALRVPHHVVRTLAPQLGSDVPFALVGGTAIVSGRGELVSPQSPSGGYALGLVVPPAELSTVEVYRIWDELGGPSGPEVRASSLPPSLRSYAPLRNDLYPAAVVAAPEVEDWRAELESRWGIPVLMTGSGSCLFGLFPSRDEAEAALESIPLGARFAETCTPVEMGWEEGTS